MSGFEQSPEKDLVCQYFKNRAQKSGGGAVDSVFILENTKQVLIIFNKDAGNRYNIIYAAMNDTHCYP